MSTAHEVLGRIKAAQAMVADLCEGKREWIMSIPARPEHDPDLVIGEALREAEAFMVATDLLCHVPDGTPLERAVRTYIHALDTWEAINERAPETVGERAAWRAMKYLEDRLRTMIAPTFGAEVKNG